MNTYVVKGNFELNLRAKPKYEISLHYRIFAIFRTNELLMDFSITTHIQSAGKHILCCYVLLNSHTYVSMTLLLSLSLSLSQRRTNVRTYTRSNNTHHYLANILAPYTSTYIHKHIQTLLLYIAFSSFILRYKKLFVWTFSWNFCLSCSYLWNNTEFCFNKTSRTDS